MYLARKIIKTCSFSEVYISILGNNNKEVLTNENKYKSQQFKRFILKSLLTMAIGIDPVLILILILIPLTSGILWLLRSCVLRLLLIDQNLNKLGWELVIGIQSS